MRQIATLPEAEARTLAGHLHALRIETRLISDADGWAVWVCDEDRVAQARQELEEFRHNPTDPRFRRPAPLPGEGEEAPSPPAPLPTGERGEKRGGPAADPRRLTVALITICVAVAVASNLGQQPTDPVAQALYITPFELTEDNRIQWNSLAAVTRGEVWRLVTPAFLHLGLVPLLLNLLGLLYLGGLIETRRGPGMLLLLVLVIAVPAHLAEYYLGRTHVTGGRLVIAGSPWFGGMSGVLYGLAGYAWIQGARRPGWGLTLPPGLMPLLILGLLAGFTQTVPRLANGAHLTGLLVGLALGELTLPRGRRTRTR